MKLLRYLEILILLLLLAASFPLSNALAAAGIGATVGVAALNVREGPGTAYRVLDVVHLGESLSVSGKDATSGWYQVALSDGRTGWVSAPLVSLAGDSGLVPLATAPGAAATASQARGRPAGGTIVFQSSSGGAIYAINADGSNFRYLTGGMDPALSPDGKQVAFTRWDGVGNGVSGSLWLINVDGTGERQLMSGANQPKSPTWSADARQIVIGMQQGGTVSDTWMCMINGRMTQVGSPPSGASCRLQAADPFWGLRIVDAGTGKYEDLPHDRHSFAPTWDPANAWRVVYRGDRGLSILDLNQKTTWLLKESGAERAPVFSPDGQKIATTFKQNDHWEVHVMNVDGSGEVRLTETPQTVVVEQILAGQQPRAWNNAAPAWSPDGSQIAFLTDRNGAYEIWVMNADGSGQHPLVPTTLTDGLNLKYEGVEERAISWR